MKLVKKNGFVLPGLRLWLGLPVSLILTACGTVPTFDGPNYVPSLRGSSVVTNSTEYTESLDCLGDYLKGKQLPKVRLAVGHVDDYSGKQDLINGRRITQGAALMVISAIARTHLPILERLDVSTAEMELKYTDNKLIGDSATNVVETPKQEGNSVRKTFAGSVVGSDYHIIGGITEVNYNIRSGSIDGTVSKFGANARYAVLDLAIDLRLVNTKTLEIVNVVSFKKQIVGTEVRAGFFSFFSDNSKLLDISAADKAQEPIQRGVRMIVERAVYELVSNLYKVPAGMCSKTTATVAGNRRPEEMKKLDKEAAGNDLAEYNDWSEYTKGTNNKWAANN